ncbi:hypothetical protein, conserved [Eimeria tenella]|uniref:Uncharacterized protein n=1 Tax=Eimeria tenella TaxID=5802 RepID=U6KW12_EIMTE|nr:hypothetical protein, conserved [Eimeria tenella]CDJ41113.1 hypothetical protein, conserved [Eimeria tenella]|eukprot:XP_013231863.1 hypothetical protein, conserved [Eimeria tenella]
MADPKSPPPAAEEERFRVAAHDPDLPAHQQQEATRKQTEEGAVLVEEEEEFGPKGVSGAFAWVPVWRRQREVLPERVLLPPEEPFDFRHLFGLKVRPGAFWLPAAQQQRQRSSSSKPSSSSPD